MSDETERPEETPETPASAAPERPRPVRNWVSMRKGSLDSRVGVSVLEKLGKDLKALAGRPRVALLMCGPSAPEGAALECRRRLAEAGFEVHDVTLAEGVGSCNVQEAARVSEALADVGATGDDVACAVGDAAALSVASFACGTWGGGLPLAVVPTDLRAALTAAITPRDLDAFGVPAALSHDGAARIQYADFDVLGSLATPSEANLLGRAFMVQTAVIDGERPFGKLWDRAEAVAAGSEKETSQQVCETLKGRGRVMGATSVATRRSISFGTVVARALGHVAPDAPASTRFAEALRLSSRLGVALAGFSVDDMLAVDELLETLGLPELEREMDPAALVAALKGECLLRSNKLMWLVPHALGKVRFSNVDDDALLEHATFWCESRAPQD